MNIHEWDKIFRADMGSRMCEDFVIFNDWDDKADDYDSPTQEVGEYLEQITAPYAKLLDNIMLMLPVEHLDMIPAYNNGWNNCLKQIQSGIEHELNRRK